MTGPAQRLVESRPAGQGAPRPLPGQRILASRYEPAGAKAGRRWGLSPRRVALLLLAAGAGCGALFLWFLFTAKPVRFEVVPADATVVVAGGFSFRVGETRLLRPGRYQVFATAPGHFDLTRDVEVEAGGNPVIVLALTRLPGRVTFVVEPPGARVAVVDQDIAGVAPWETSLPAGRQQAELSSPRHQPATLRFNVVGMERAQTVTATLAPNWAEVTIPTSPPGATVLVDGQPVAGVTPGPVEILAGDARRVTVKLRGHRRWRDLLRVVAGEALTLPAVTLAPADGLVSVATTPPGAGVTLDGGYMGETPLEFTASPGAPHRLRVFKVGYAPAAANLDVGVGEERVVRFDLEALRGELALTVVPDDARLWVNGEARGQAAGVLSLPAAPHQVEIKKAGYADYRKTITPRPGFTQDLKVRLLTLAEARLAALKQVRATGAGQELVLLAPGAIRMGASRREPGRRANEVPRTAKLSRLFYLGRDEVTNAQFRAFAPAHDSGEFQSFTLDDDKQPVVRVAWRDAARYCNWLSARDGLAPFYTERDGAITGFDGAALGYRLPTEAEWAWAARGQPDGEPPLRFAWGNQLPPPERHGNYADVSAAHVVGRTIIGYNDNHIVSAIVPTFAPNARGVRHLGGNVAEWVHDFYEIPSADDVADPLGPASGEYHVIRGASWMRGTVSDLRLSYRDYGVEGRPDVGFRLARYAE